MNPPYTNPFGYSAVNYGTLSPTYHQQSLQQLQPISSNQSETYPDYHISQHKTQQDSRAFTHRFITSSPNIYTSPVRYAKLSSENEPSPFPFSVDRTRHSSMSSPQQQYYYQRMSPPPPIMTVRRDPMDYVSDQRSLYVNRDNIRPISPDPYFPYSSFERTIYKQRVDSPDFSIKQEYDIYPYQSSKPIRTNMSEDNEPRCFSVPIKSVQKVIQEKEFLVTEEYTGKREFDTMNEAINVLTSWAETQHVVLRKGSGNNKTMKDGTKKKIVLVCQCSGKYRSCSYSPRGASSASNSSCEEGQPTNSTPQRTVKKRRSKKTECPFRINLNYRANTNTWNITKMILEHNHE
ncbi:FAR1 DNA-binding domain containing protein [Entamoeba histolytica HM-1:IMSS-B]|uniref:FAR1 domain-containing protein n=6 Tax=Entamoeba histolytica TaxID=5759 RepID=C4M336_ENTH1|nr:hypothetical protein EHI_059650 [Entamoeba histolytica HM-1:IMSS]EMD44106.1 FAR1 DNAbinding domain containing protein [Entamoeba histolytica KU27]EMH75447.1 FAR1 DNA-binding domain containing protein [Entamoeba histolytica HM-1:IMSS-B]EMS11917.1 FAR1 DNA-binding domain containing protein [Entamoeba histolytica HM-3:IMSS]ENY62451.1 FAR1 DNA-binding domain containing protein [Entamoeba histolytica HM-1:IMSS-A]GAT95713.1 hypothetical protein CL6EHI_059650 [Entamoeba histolytica]|eukprot:XP_652889.1 hypothetical protein EHI_059650 [Entamoeba histolytica HM-1:IMSS]